MKPLPEGCTESSIYYGNSGKNTYLCTSERSQSLPCGIGNITVVSEVVWLHWRRSQALLQKPTLWFSGETSPLTSFLLRRGHVEKVLELCTALAIQAIVPLHPQLDAIPSRIFYKMWRSLCSSYCAVMYRIGLLPPEIFPGLSCEVWSSAGWIRF